VHEPARPLDMNELIPLPGGEVFRWNDGTPTSASGHQTVTKEQMNGLIHAAASRPSRGKWDPDSQRFLPVDPEFEGLSNAEVVALQVWRKAAEGNPKFIEMALDRTLGKPKMNMDITAGVVTLPDLLERLAREDGLYNSAPGDRPASQQTIAVVPDYVPVRTMPEGI
jgi:hypothetical protein